MNENTEDTIDIEQGTAPATTDLALVNSTALVNQGRSIAQLCREIVEEAATPIQGKRYVRLEAQGKLPQGFRAALQQATGLHGPASRKATKLQTTAIEAQQSAYDKAAIAQATSLKSDYPDELKNALASDYNNTSREQLEAAKARLAKAEAKLEDTRKRAENDEGTPKSHKTLEAYNRALAQLEKAQDDHARVLFRYAARKATKARNNATRDQTRQAQLDAGWQAAQQAFGKQPTQEQHPREQLLAMPAVPILQIEPNAEALQQGKHHDEALRITANTKYQTARKLGPVTMQDGRQVQLTMVGFRETKSHSRDIRLLDLLSSIRKPLEKAVYITSAAPTPAKKTKPTTRAYHYYGAKLIHSGQELYARLVIRENTNEEIYYDADLSSIEKVTAQDLAATPPNAGADVLGGDSMATQGDHPHSLRQLLDSVNHKFAQTKSTVSSHADTTFSLTGIPQNVEHEIQARTERIRANRLSQDPTSAQARLQGALLEAKIAKQTGTPPSPSKDKQGILSRSLSVLSETLRRLDPDLARRLRRMEFYLAQLKTPIAQGTDDHPYRKHILARLRQLEKTHSNIEAHTSRSLPNSNDQFPTLNEPTPSEYAHLDNLTKEQLQQELRTLDQTKPTPHLANTQAFQDAYSTLPTDIRQELDLALKNSDTTPPSNSRGSLRFLNARRPCLGLLPLLKVLS